MKTIEKLEEMLKDMSEIEVAIEVSSITDRRTSDPYEMTEEEAILLLDIHAKKVQEVEQQNNLLIAELKRKEWRSKILALAEKTGIKEPGDFQKFNNWMLQYGKYKKQLTAHTLPELQVLYKQLRAVQWNDKVSGRMPLNRAWWKRANELKAWN